MTHADIGRGRAGGAASESLVDRVVLAGIAHACLHQRHVLFPVVVVVEARTGIVGIHHTYLDHGLGLLLVRRLWLVFWRGKFVTSTYRGFYSINSWQPRSA